VLESRRCLTVLDETRQFGHELRVAGSGAANPAFRADLADATRRRVGAPGGDDGAAASSSARGAALLAALAIDGIPPAPAGDAAGTGPAPAWPAAEPDPGRAAIWDELWASYEQARHAVAQHYHAKAALRGRSGGRRTGPAG
jgi:sugar (pentulose or hexulose) kinase